MHRRLRLTEVVAHRPFDAGGGHRQAQVEASGGAGRLAPGAAQAELTGAARQGAFDQLRLGIAFRRRRRFQGQGMRGRPLAELLQHANPPLPRPAVTAARVEVERRRPLLFALQLLGQAKQQLGMATLQPGIGAGEAGEVGEHRLDRFAGREQLAAMLQVQVVLEVLARTEGPRVGGERHLFVTVDAQLGEDELRPVLGEVAEEQQAQTVAQLADLQAVDPFVEGRAPVGEAPRLGLLLGQHGEQLGLLRRAMGAQGGEARQQLVLAQQGEQGLQRQDGGVAQPAEGEQRGGGRGDVADLRIVELAGAKVRALAHDQAHQQRLGGGRQRGEAGEEVALRVAQQVGVARVEPGEGGAEVAQVVEAGVQHG
ncbi:hypothetical protein D9M69_475690 [compost metagenome]